MGLEWVDTPIATNDVNHRDERFRSDRDECKRRRRRQRQTVQRLLFSFLSLFVGFVLLLLRSYVTDAEGRRRLGEALKI